MTKKQLLALARKRWPKAQLCENPRALDGAAKETLRQQCAAWRERKAALDEEIKAAGDTRKKLIEAARFAVDVNGDEPSWSQLREAVVLAERIDAAREERADIAKQLDRSIGKLHSRRWDVCWVDELVRGFPLCHVECSADTLEELAQKIQEKSQVSA